jgi:hypothetical protein
LADRQGVRWMMADCIQSRERRRLEAGKRHRQSVSRPYGSPGR